MTLSDTSVQKFVKQRFVSAWVNLEGDSAAGSSFAHAPGDDAGTCVRGNGRANLQILVLTPDGRILHAITGYVGPEDLRAELDWALETFALMKTTPTLESAMVGERARDHAESGPKPTGRELDHLRAHFSEEAFARLTTGLVARSGSDMRFVAENPLMPIAHLRTSMLTGGGVSFFGSKSGNQSGGTIGSTEGPSGMSPEEIREMVNELRAKAGGTTPTGDS